jgi:hypothetical protein
MEDVDAKLQEEEKNRIEWTQKKQEIKLNKLSAKLDRLKASSTSIQNTIDIRNAQGYSTTASQYKQLVKNSQNQVKKIILQYKKHVSHRLNGITPLLCFQSTTCRMH